MRAIYVAGADPELMLVSPEGELLSAIGRLKGTKKRPFKTSKGAVQRDNVMAEFNVLPAESLEEFQENIRATLTDLAGLIAPNRLVVRASADFPASQLRHRDARRFGCDPDYNAWTLMRNQIPPGADLLPFRSAGGHLHIGKTPEIAPMLDDDYGKIAVVKMLDIFVGIPSLLLDSDGTAPARRALYGKAGAHRPKPYGVEYRALGNFWVRSPALVEIVYRLADVAVRLCAAGHSDAIFERVGAEKAQEIINDSRIDDAAQVVEQILPDYIPEALVDEILGRSQVQDMLLEQDLYETWGIQL